MKNAARRCLTISLCLRCASLYAAVPLNIDAIARPAGKPPSITWSGESGKAYRVEYRDQLQSGGWVRDPFPRRSSGSTLTWRESTAVVPDQRFYRIVQPDTLQFTNPGPGGGSFIMSIAVHPQNGNIVYFGGDIEGPFRTADGGQSFQRVTGDLAGGGIDAGVYAGQMLHLDPNAPNRLYMTSWNGLFRTDAEGRNWTDLGAGEGNSVASVAVSPSDSNLLLVGTGDVEGNIDGTSSIYRSTDGGASFINVTETGVFAQTDTTTHVILFNPINPSVVYAATGEGVIKSQDAGLTWAFMNNGLPTSPIVHGLVGAEHAGSFRLFATLQNQTTEPQAMDSTAFVGGGVFRSMDGASTWEDITGNLPRSQEDEESDPTPFLPYSYWRVVVDPVNPDNLFVGTENLGDANAYENLGVYRSANALASNSGDVAWNWSMPENAFTDMGWLDNIWWLDLHIGFLGIDPSNPSVLYAGSDHLFKTTDGGATWTEVYSETVDLENHRFRGRGVEAMEPFAVAVDPNDPNRWWVGYDDMGLFRTDDAGESWFRIDDKQNSVNLGETDCPASLAVDPSNSSIIYQGRNNGENDQPDNWNIGVIFKSTDGGASWSQLGSGSLGSGRPTLMMMPGGDESTRTIFAAIYGQGLFRSNDSGSTWAASNTGFTTYDQTHIWDLARHPSDNTVLYVGIADGSFNDAPSDGGVYKSTDGGASWSRLGGTAPTGQIIDVDVAPDGAVYAACSDVFSTHRQGAGTRQGGIYRSSDDGISWTRVLDAPRADHVDVAAGDGRYVIAGISTKFDVSGPLNAGIYISRDSGATWARESDGLTHTRLWLAHFHPTDLNRVLVGTGGGGLFVGSGAAR